MKKVIHICDKCNTEKIYNKSEESEFRVIKLLIGKIGKDEYVSDVNTSSISTIKNLFICKECQFKLGLNTDKRVDDNFYQQPELIDKILELFIEIADKLGYVKGE